ncbi:hypothetical protein BJ508DRAFT_375385 [Ascobolus immersus RN42]|uniref:Uncharacterized protein n=1 Tax=Ascobolus immersus RN42 TaxID=1160509 RepID=A0A3N4IBN6_ASCIM|nr:hypothetical protein BJ508DRAFT_375385 [Ascobolus immersus RN42]
MEQTKEQTPPPQPSPPTTDSPQTRHQLHEEDPDDDPVETLKPSNIPPELSDFLAICERDNGMVAYDRILFDWELEEWLEEKGCSGFIFMLFKHDAPKFDCADTVWGLRLERAVVHLSANGNICVWRQEEGGRLDNYKWTYTQECYLKIAQLLRYLTTSFVGGNAPKFIPLHPSNMLHTPNPPSPHNYAPC